MTLQTKNLGLVQAIFVGSTPPSNVNMIWRDTSTTPHSFKQWDNTQSQWSSLSQNLGNSNLLQTSSLREYTIPDLGELRFKGDAIFAVGLNDENRVGEVRLHSVVQRRTAGVAISGNTSIGVVEEFTPDKIFLETRTELGNSATKKTKLELSLSSLLLEYNGVNTNSINLAEGIQIIRNGFGYKVGSDGTMLIDTTFGAKLKMENIQTLLEHKVDEGGALSMNSVANIFEDRNAVKRGLQYMADYSATLVDFSLTPKIYVENRLSTKQDTLVSGTNIKTLNGDSLLGAGNIEIISENLATNNLNLPATTERTFNIPSDSTLDFGALMKLYGTGTVDFTSDVTVDNVQFKGGVGTQGEMSWSTDEETVKLIMDGTTLYVGQDTFVHVRNNTASIITKGTAVYATGTLGASGRITVAPMIADGTIPGRLFIGLAAENIAIGSDGQVITFGKIRQIDTTAYNDGDVLWLSPTIAGSLTATEPAAPNLKIATAFVIHDAVNGTLMVRAEQGNDLHSDQRVQVSGLTNGDILTWNNTNQRWQNAQPVSNNIYTSNGTIGTTRVATLTDTLSFSGGRVSFDTTTNGILLPRLTTIQMNAIASPTTNTILYNTDLNGLYRYNGSAWVALSSGYGIIEVQSGTGTGQPTYFADLQSALETCKASGGYFTVKLYSNIVITSAIEIDYTGSGTGKAYLFRQLTIDFNGFSITNAQANTTDAFTLQLSNTASVYQEVRILNGTVLRTNGTGTHHALKCDQTGRFGTIQMSKMLWYCQNGQTARIGLGLSTAVDADRVCDLGGSTFISNASGARTMTLPNSATTVTNFRVYHTGALDALYMDTGRAHNFYAENTSTGKAILAVGSNFIISQFDCKSNSGIALDLNGSGAEAHNFTAKSTSGEAVSVKGTAIATSFKCDTGNNHALRVEGNSIAKDAFCQNNSATLAAVTATDYNRLQNIEGINLGASFGGRIQQAQALRGALRSCTFISIGGIGAEIISTTNNINADNCNFESQLDSSSGHALRVSSITSGTFTITKCNFTIRNAGANVLNAAAATTVRVALNTHNQVATTPINANVTPVAIGF